MVKKESGFYHFLLSLFLSLFLFESFTVMGKRGKYFLFTLYGNGKNFSELIVLGKVFSSLIVNEKNNFLGLWSKEN